MLRPLLSAALLLCCALNARGDGPAYKIQKWDGGTYAVFDGWLRASIPSPGWFSEVTAPKGKTQEFILRIAVGTPDKTDQEKFFDNAPKSIPTLAPGAKKIEDAKKCTFASWEGRRQRFEVKKTDGTVVTLDALFLKQKDLAVAIVGIGTESGMKEFGKSVDITAKNLAFKESILEKGLAGSWDWSTTTRITGVGDRGNLSMTASRKLTITAQGTFTLRVSGVGVGTQRSSFGFLKDGTYQGKVIRRGNILTFHDKNGKRWSEVYLLKGNNGLSLDGKLYSKD